MKKNKIVIYLTFLILIFIVGVPSTYKVVKRHQERLLLNTIKQITEAAKDCYYNESCIDERITLAELYEKTSLGPQNNPITKKIYNSNSYVNVKEDFLFVEVE